MKVKLKMQIRSQKTAVPKLQVKVYKCVRKEYALNILGALKKAKSLSTVYFCEYDANEISWESVSRLLTLYPNSLRTEQTFVEEDLSKLSEDMIRCVAIESVDRLNTDKRLVGAMFECDGKFISVAVPSYYDLDIYLCDLFPNSLQNPKSSTG